MLDATALNSTRPYLIRGLHEWCVDNGYTPFIVVSVDPTVRVPSEFVKNGEIVLNISFDATSALRLGNDCIEFKGRFGGASKEIFVPVDRVLAIYARENGQGMTFPVPGPLLAMSHAGDSNHFYGTRAVDCGDDPPPGPSSPSRPVLKRIK